MALTPEDVANMALGILDEVQITSLDEDVKAARLLNLHFDTTRESELTKHTWVFAILRETLTGTDISDDDCALDWVYELPTDCLRPLPLTHNGEPEPFGLPVSWRQEGDLLYTDQSSPRRIRYIANLTDPNDWTALFTDVIAAALAVKIALPLTHKSGMVELARTAYDTAVQSAKDVNAIQRGGDLYQGSWAQARGDDRSPR